MKYETLAYIIGVDKYKQRFIQAAVRLGISRQRGIDESRSITQREIAEVLGVTERSVNRWLSTSDNGAVPLMAVAALEAAAVKRA